VVVPRWTSLIYAWKTETENQVVFHYLDSENFSFYISILGKIDEDLGYGTLPTSLSMDSGSLILRVRILLLKYIFYLGSMISYVVHDKNIRSQLNEYSERLTLLVDNLQSDLSENNTYKNPLSIHDTRKKICFIFS
jgi:hypothetical protein